MRRGATVHENTVVNGYVHYLCVGIQGIVNIFQPRCRVGGGISPRARP